MEMMAASQRSQQEAFQELARVSKDKSNDSMFTAIKTFDGTNRHISRIGSTKSTRLAEQVTEVSGQNCSRNQPGGVRQVILSCDSLSDNELVTKLCSCFSHAPTMNEVREELRNWDRWSTNQSLSTGIDGAVPCTGPQASDLTKKDTPHNQGFYFFIEEKH